jgi:hypothetical protein
MPQQPQRTCGLQSGTGVLPFTAHYMNCDVELKSTLLDCFKHDKNHMVINLAQELKRVTREWPTGPKVLAVVSGNAGNIVVAVRLTEWKHVPCFAHNLNLILEYCLQGSENVHTQAESVVAFSSSSPRASIAPKSMQQQLGKPVLIFVSGIAQSV